jgi:uncharacterized membrane protein YgdD (TMEM256/DUF423 family)
MMHANRWLVCAALLGALGVSLGALGAHGLEAYLRAPLKEFKGESAEREKMTDEIDARLANWETAVRYHMIHALAIALAAIVIERRPSRILSCAAWAFLAGIALFSGCLYAYVVLEVKPLVHFVPIGGVLLIVGWILLALGARRRLEEK